MTDISAHRAGQAGPQQLSLRQGVSGELDGDFDAVTGAPAGSVAARWHALLRKHLRQGVGTADELVVTCSFRVPAFFRARIRSGALGALHYCHLDADARDSRIAGLVPPGSGRQLVVLQLSGTSRVEAGPQAMRLRPGDVLSVHDVDMVRVQDEGKVEQLVLMLAITEAVQALPGGLRQFHPDCALAKLAFRWVRDGCLAAGAIPASLGTCIAQMLSGLLVQAFTAQTLPRAERPSCISAQAIQEYIEHRIADPCLSLHNIAQAFGCSVRTLHRTFNRPGAPSLGQYLWRRRIEVSAQILRETGAVSRTLTQIAIDLGFCSSAHFSTLFRKAFGVSPSEYRRHAQCASSNGVEVELARAA